MTASLRGFDPRVGGGYRTILTHDDTSHGAGKTAPDREEIEVRFVELIAEERVTDRVTFLSNDPAFAGEMLHISSFPPGIGRHQGSDDGAECAARH